MLLIFQLTNAQEKRIRVFEKKAEGDVSVKTAGKNLHLIVFPLGRQISYIIVNQNKSWEVDEVNLQEWKELPGNTLVVVQSVEEEAVKNVKTQPSPILLSNFTFHEFKQLPDKEIVNYVISWSMNTLYAGDSSIQTSKKIVSSNCCDKGTCSILVSVEKKK
ncbi:hypothetical protein [Flavobacterium sp. H122]|uniref:hypothetical protein n=1 Tax=Flavobacterium sp. H122 TaxID=2529860 RepID=UPI0010AA0C59|nr:hypothetical protein [Flavobacterium sp. H122]